MFFYSVHELRYWNARWSKTLVLRQQVIVLSRRFVPRVRLRNIDQLVKVYFKLLEAKLLEAGIKSSRFYSEGFGCPIGAIDLTAAAFQSDNHVVAHAAVHLRV
jgi:hypothetical protein